MPTYHEKIIQNKESGRNCPSQEAPKGTMKTQ